MAGIAAGVGLLTYSLLGAGTYALTQRLDPTMQTLSRNLYGASGLVAIGGIALAATKSPLLGAGIAAGGLTALAGAKLALAIGDVIDKKPSSSMPVGDYRAMGAYQPMGEVYGQIGDYRAMGQVYGNMGQVFGNMGALVPNPPWQGNPF